MPLSPNMIAISGNSDTDTTVKWYTNAQDVGVYYGTGAFEYNYAKKFFSSDMPGALFGIVRYGSGQRAHDLSGNLCGLPLSYFQSIAGPLSVNLTVGTQTYNYSANIDLAGGPTVTDMAKTIQSDLYNNTKEATLYNVTIVPHSITFEGNFALGPAQLTEVSGPPLIRDGVVSGPGIVSTPGASQIIFDHHGHYSTQAAAGTLKTNQTYTETYATLEDLGGYNGNLALGERLADGGQNILANNTAILQNLGNGEYVINNIPLQPINNLTLYAEPPRLTVQLDNPSSTNYMLSIQEGPQYGGNYTPHTLSEMSGSAADALHWTQTEGAQNGSPGGIVETTAQWANSILAQTGGQFGAFETSGIGDHFDPALTQWGIKHDGRQVFDTATPARGY